MDFLYLLIPTVLFIILFMPLFVGFKVTLDALTFSGVISIFLFKFKFHHFIYKFDGKKFVFQEDGKDDGEFELSEQQMIFYKTLFSEVKDKTRLKTLFVFYNIGLNDAYRSAMTAGTVNAFLLIFFTAIKNQKPTASLGVYDTVSYNREVCEFAIKCRISVTIFDILYALLISYITSVREPKREKEKQMASQENKA